MTWLYYKEVGKGKRKDKAAWTNGEVLEFQQEIKEAAALLNYDPGQ